MIARNGIRMLASVMFTDMVGYTSLMQEDEERAKLLRDRYRKVLEEKVFEHLGKVIHYFGDGALTIFGSVIESVICAKEIQAELLKEPKVNLRIGIHAGEIVYDDEGVYGDTVNIASRIESLSKGGCVLFSSKVNDELKNHSEFKTKSLGLFELKNVKYPVEIFALQSEDIVVPNKNDFESRFNLRNESIAVLPFVNMSNEPDNEFFSDGITEEILNALSKIEELKVTSRTSSFAFKGKNFDIREIGKQLGVRNLLEGSVRKVGNRVRITAQLIDTLDGYHKWSDTFDRDIKDIFQVQDEIATTIVSTLKKSLKIQDSQKKPLVKIPTTNLEAYQLFLKANYFWNKWTPTDIRRSLQLLKKSVEIDSNFAQGFSALAACYVYLGAIGQLPNQIANEEAKKYALKALSMDDQLPDGHLSLAMANLFDWKWDESYKSFQKALELSPNNADAHHYYAYYMMAINNTRKAVIEAEKAHELDPLSLPINAFLGDMYLNAGMILDAIEQYKKTLEIDSTFRAAINGLGWAYYQSGNMEEALKLFKKSQEIAGDEFKSTANLGYIYAKSGELDKVNDCLDKIKFQEKKLTEVNYTIDYALVYLGLGNYDKVFEYLNKAFEDKLGALIFIRSRSWKEIHDDERFKALLSKMNLPTD
ncbi:adenylate/guanylate cyclase domain-containing protein [Ignavibacterium sp.]|uniref:adenylate/guanylate cyclase domain-containing protein n=1 Tax=Ignavibacterium sp. TaxID=2651167 RepID=UPI0021F9D7C9|nr:adenylate/guanylate cyclase domain-containing protein [Ignavibacterium sp.]BDQ02148.1 MAG: adenylate cyclase [Ignavibacterium sp.]